MKTDPYKKIRRGSAPSRSKLGLMQLNSAILLSLVFFSAALVHGGSPFYFHTHAIARIEAAVEKKEIMQVPVKNSSKSLQRESTQTATPLVDVQKISLRILKVTEYISKHAAVPPIRYGQIIEVTNPYLDQVPAFEAGDKIRIRVRLVLPEEEFDPKDPRKQWWCYPEDEKEDIFPPRHPFKDINVIR